MDRQGKKKKKKSIFSFGEGLGNNGAKLYLVLDNLLGDLDSLSSHGLGWAQASLGGAQPFSQRLQGFMELQSQNLQLLQLPLPEGQKGRTEISWNEEEEDFYWYFIASKDFFFFFLSVTQIWFRGPTAVVAFIKQFVKSSLISHYILLHFREIIAVVSLRQRGRFWKEVSKRVVRH